MKSLLTLSLLLFAACDLHLEAATPPPPGATAVVDNDDKVITLSRGVAVGVDCRDGGHLCTGMNLEVEDSEIAAAYVSFDAELEYTIDGFAPKTSLVVVGRAEGKTFLHVDADGGGVTYEVEVLRE